MTTQPRVALVTGASRGIGAAIARRLASGGFHVVVNFRTSHGPAQEIIAQIVQSGGTAEARQADVANRDEARSLVRAIAATHKRLDVLVNNAGRTEDGPLLLMPDDRWWAVIRDNLAPVVNCSRAALSLMVQNGGGSIVNIASVAGVHGIEGLTAYGSAKAAIIGFTRALAREVSGRGIYVNCVAPGPIDTEMYAHATDQRRQARIANVPVQRIGRPEEVAEVVALLVEGRAAFVVGQTICVDGGVTA